MATILLTSTGLSEKRIKDEFIDLVKNNLAAQVLIITNACVDGKENKYAQLAYQQFLSIGFKMIHFCDLVTDGASAIASAGVVYICGGNTYKLLAAIQQSNSAEQLKSFLVADDHFLIGVSAGAIVLGQSITTSFDENTVGLMSTEGLHCVPFSVIVHFDEKRNERYQELSRTMAVKTLTNSQALIITPTETKEIDG